ncbi:MAG: hypothetical protein M3Z25_23245 [Actinomycetota bacterium]|nr:hypothetical protein [Actinomycetota bacterium]
MITPLAHAETAFAFVADEVDDTLHAALAAHLSDREIVELRLVAGTT